MKSRRKQQKPARKISTWMWGLLVLALILATGAAILTRSNSPESATEFPREISVAQAAEKLEEGAFMLDVRETYEWNEVHVPGSTLIPLAELPNRLAELPTNQEIIVICRSGNRSAAGRDILREAGFELTTSINGGITDWFAQGYPTTSGP